MEGSMRNIRQTANDKMGLLSIGMTLMLIALLSPAFGQSQLSSEFGITQMRLQGDSAQITSAPVTITLQDALERAQKNDVQYLSAVTNARLSHEDRLQARASLLPSFSLTSQYLNTQGNGVLPSGRYITNDGVHVYRDWSVVHQDLSPGVWTRTGYERAIASEAVGRAQAKIARRGLVVTVTAAYSGLVVAQRKYATAQQALEQARSFFALSQTLERGGEIAHSDVIKFRLQYDAQDRAFREAALAMTNARLDLAVLLFPNFDQNFEVVDNLQLAPVLPSFAEVQEMARRKNPDLQAATAALRIAKLDVSSARQAFLPSMAVELDYGIEANAFALSSTVASDKAAGRLPNLGYFLTATLNVPVWNWGATRSKLRQAELKRQQADVELSAAQRQLVSNLYRFYKEAETAREELTSLRSSADGAAESLRLNILRYQAGEATVLEIVDAQNTLILARNARDDGQIRYSVALAKLQTLTGSF